MSKVKTASGKKPRSFGGRISAVLIAGLNEAGIEAEITFEKVPQTRLWRFTVISDNFEQMRPSERQDFVWRVIENGGVQPHDQMRISMILTLAPAELV